MDQQIEISVEWVVAMLMEVVWWISMEMLMGIDEDQRKMIYNIFSVSVFSVALEIWHYQENM